MSLMIKNKKITNIINSNNINSEIKRQVSNAFYVIELEKFNITEGFVTRDNNMTPYTESDWEIAKNNVLGFQSAINYACENNIRHLIVPHGNYSMCYLKSPFATNIIIPSNIELDLNGSTIKVMYDSIQYPPFATDDDKTKSVWRRGGILFGFEKAYNSKIYNGEIIGDIYDRAFQDIQDGTTKFDYEYGQENTYGIAQNSSSNNCTIENIKVRGFMGDGLTAGATHTVTLSMNFVIKTSENVDVSTGELKEASGCMSTSFIDTKGERRIVMKGGLGYNRVLPSNFHSFTYVFYDENKNFICSVPSGYLSPVVVPLNTKYFKAAFVNEPTDITEKTYGFFFSNVPNHNYYIKNCIITENHRGGITGGASHTVIENCDIYNNGAGHLEGIKAFPDTTRYQFNAEDSFSEEITIKNCRIDASGAINGLLIGAYHINVTDNILINCNVIVYDNSTTLIKGNTFKSLQKNCYQVVSTATTKSSTGSVVLIEGNTFTNCYVSKGSNTKTFVQNNIFNFQPSNNNIAIWLNANYLNNNYFTAKLEEYKSKIKLTINSGNDLKDNKFENMQIQFNNLYDIEKNTFIKCLVSTSNSGDGVDNKTIFIKNCIFKQSNFATGWFNGNVNMKSCNFIDCNVTPRVCINQSLDLINTLPLLSYFEDCQFNGQCNLLFDSNVSGANFKFVLKDCQFDDINIKSIHTVCICDLLLLNSTFNNSLNITSVYKGIIKNCIGSIEEPIFDNITTENFLKY